jgi:hypothetical protein
LKESPHDQGQGMGALRISKTVFWHHFFGAFHTYQGLPVDVNKSDVKQPIIFDSQRNRDNVRYLVHPQQIPDCIPD